MFPDGLQVLVSKYAKSTNSIRRNVKPKVAANGRSRVWLMPPIPETTLALQETIPAVCAQMSVLAKVQSGKDRALHLSPVLPRHAEMGV